MYLLHGSKHIHSHCHNKTERSHFNKFKVVAIQGTTILNNHDICITDMHTDKKKSEEKFEEEIGEMKKKIEQQNEGISMWLTL